jgi:large subunit ribosomal protein L5|uniref:Large ribosomal subunit protein uL5 n=1 Tax=candidate division WOR-3 bacterium TaxID=2052148 RepID=A0A7V3RGG1_UNCW3
MKKEGYKPRLKIYYEETLRKALMKKLGYKNIYQVPELKKIVINCGVGEAVSDPKILEIIKEDLAKITGQAPVYTRAKRPISNFKIRKGMIIGMKVTLRGNRMYEFFDRFINFAAPRIRDFRGFKRDSFDGRGSYNLGLTEQTIFPEIEYDKVKKVFGMDIAIVTSAKNDEDALALLEGLGMPFEKKK